LSKNTVHPVPNDFNPVPNTSRAQTASQKISNFLQGPYFEYFVWHRKVRWIILFVFTAILAVFLAFATFIKPDEKQVRNIEKAL
jgi:hypothetical protein